MKRIKTCVFACFAILILSMKAFAQCPSSFTASAVTTDASCPSNGTATINTNPAASASFNYAIIAGPARTALNVLQASNVFNALLPGDYTVQVSCGMTQATVSFTILDKYIPISNINAVVMPNCGSFSPGGTVDISVDGGSAPFMYSIVSSNDPNYPDAQSIYTSDSGKSVSSYGTYQVRVKDACNQFVTKTVIVASPLLPMEVYLSEAFNDGCNSHTATLSIYLYNSASGTYGNPANYQANGGIKIRIWEADPVNSCAPYGPMIYQTLLSNNPQLTGVPVIPSRKYYIQSITACGDTSGNCIDASSSFTPAYYVNSSTSGCNHSEANPPTMRIGQQRANFMVYPIQVLVKNSAGTVIYTTTLNSTADTWSLPGLPFDDYTITATDACGNTITNTIVNPAAAGPPVFSFSVYDPNGCIAGGTTQEGATGAYMYVSGYQEDLSNTTVTILSGPSNAGTQGSPVWGGGWGWANILPGTYVIRVSTSCGSQDYTVTANPSPAQIWHQAITAEALSACGGGGSVNAMVVTNINGQKSYDLINADNGQVVVSNFNGLFDNIAPGNYYIRMGAINCSGSYYYLNSNTVTLASGTGPQIVKQLGISCEDVNGNPLNTGAAYLTIAGASPLIVEYKLTSSSAWTTYSSDAPAETTISGLVSGAVYDVRITSCGITTATQVTIEQMGTVRVNNALEPCTGNAYELTLPQLPGAVYEWKNEAGTVVSTSFNYTIARYNSTYDGKYIAALTWGNCLKRADTVLLNSLQCGAYIVLPVNLSSFTGRTQNCTTMLQWKTTSAGGLTGFNIERSTNGNAYVTIGNRPKTSEAADYNYTDNSQLQDIVNYRLKMIDADGRYQYSNTITVNAKCNSANTQWLVYPSLMQQGSTVNIKLTTINIKAITANIAVTSVTGQRLYTYNVTVQPGQNNYTLPFNNNQAPGTYLVYLFDDKGQRIGAVQKLVYIK